MFLLLLCLSMFYCYGFCQPSLPSYPELCDKPDEQLFDKIQQNEHHFLHYLLPPPSAASQCYNLRTRPHTQQLPQHPGHLIDFNTSLLEYYTKTFTDAIIWLYTHTSFKYKLIFYRILLFCCYLLAFCQVWSLNKYVLLLMCVLMCVCRILVKITHLLS